MTTLQLDEQTARKLYASAIPELKAIMDQSFPEGFFSQSIIDRVNTMDDIFSIAGKTLKDLTAPGDTPDEVAYKVLKLGISVFNEGKKVDHSNSAQVKYEPLFSYKSGLGLSYNDYVNWATGTRCGPRLCYLNLDALKKGVKVMEKYYNDYLNSK